MARRSKSEHPARRILLGFLFALLGGTILLMLPVATTDTGSGGFLPAIFTATSALCVTGLTTVNVATYWSSFGHFVIMLLIQLGGFGVMSFATILGFSITRKISWGRRMATAAETHGSYGGLNEVLGRVIKTSLVIESVVMIALSVRFLTLGYPPSDAFWYGLFHSISSFNNAGFSLIEGGIVPYVSDWFICLPLMLAIIVGGLGFPVLHELYRYHRWRWSLTTRLVLFGTCLVLLLSTIFVTALEWNNPATLGRLPNHAKILAGTFQAVQTRTAGFNSIDIGALNPSTLLGMDLFMFIGGGPAGTAGGVKITTVLVLLFIAWNDIRGEESVNILGRCLSPTVHREVITVTLLAASVVVLSTMSLMLLTPFSLDRTLFEAVSAFGTVGLSTGITGQLNPPAQIVLIILMFIGRLGPITVATALAKATRKRRYELPKERPIIG